MNTGFRTSLSAGLFLVTFMFTLLLMPVASQAQTFFGSGGSTNTTDNVESVALGFGALNSTTTTDLQNTAIGYNALSLDTTGTGNVAIGFEALFANLTGGANTADGYEALSSNSVGIFNTAVGEVALFFNTTGNGNTAIGVSALHNNTSGEGNIALGESAGVKLTEGSNNIDIGNGGAAKESGVIRIGTKGAQRATYIAGIDGITASKGVAVYINANGQLGTLTSSRRFKNDIHDMGHTSDRLMQLRPVTFRYKEAAEDGTHPIEYGLIAEEVAKVYPNLVQYDKAGKPFTIYYHLLTPMLLNELQKTHRQYDAMRSAHQAEIASLKGVLQKQSAELAMLKQSQQQQLSVLAKLTALVQTSQHKAPLQSVVSLQH